MHSGTSDEQVKTITLEAFADTIVPGEKRSPDDRAIAGVSTGGGAVQSGALEMLHHPATGITAGLESLVGMLNGHATNYAADKGITLDDTVPPFVALEFDDRVALIRILTTPGHPEKSGWVLLALFCNMAFDSAAHISTHDAIAEGHPGLLTIGFELPQKDGLWRFKDYSYGRQFAKPHPDTTATGSPA
ncbi:hypothetical protein [Alloactinosynnema sp. L-07]|uniref:DUF5987 family protein n=1 Tax=Alloactinosynnema sp. L-07 TaxID=1653480 RepID=UPI00065EF718|nr:DUF5987 family protein [Alloactinosynnema sp. L-07]CRK57509.1 hypothetical protein [Alloactinosynnema sp. L-07]